MNTVYTIEIEWSLQGEYGHDILAITNKECVIPIFQKLVKREQSESYLVEYFNLDGTLREDRINEVEYYEYTDSYFNFSTKDDEILVCIDITPRQLITSCD